MWAGKQFIYALDWLDRVILRCKWRWFCHMVQTPAWELLRQDLEEEWTTVTH